MVRSRVNPKTIQKTPMKAFVCRALAVLVMAEGALLAETNEDLLKKADVFDRKFQAAEALAIYQELEKSQPEDPALLLRMARQYRHLMADASSREEKVRMGHLALTYAERAAALAPRDAEAQLSVAITLGKMHSIESSKEQVEGSRRLKASVDRALALEPGNDLAWHLLGRWHEGYADLSTVRRGVGELIYGKLPQSTHEEAAECFQKAVAANPRRLMHYIELGIVYAKMGRNAEAREMLEKGLKMPATGKDDPDYKARGKEALKKLP